MGTLVITNTTMNPKNFQLGGNVPRVFGIDQGFAKPLKVDLTPVVQSAAMPIDAGEKTHIALQHLDLQREELEIAKDRKERQKFQDQVNNLKLIAEFSEKSSKWGVLPGRLEDYKRIMGPLTDVATMGRAVSSTEGAADWLGKWTQASVEMQPFLRERAVYDESKKAHEFVVNKLMDLTKDDNAMAYLDPTVKQRLTDWGKRLEEFANGVGSETDIAAYTAGIQNFFNDEAIAQHAEDARANAKATRDLKSAQTKTALANIEITIAKQEGRYAEAAKTLGLNPGIPFAERTEEEQLAITGELARRENEKEDAQRMLVEAQTNVALGSLDIEQQKLTLEALKALPENINAYDVINLALPEEKQLKSLPIDLGELKRTMESLTPEERADFVRAIRAQASKLRALSGTTRSYGSTADFKTWVEQMDELVANSTEDQQKTWAEMSPDEKYEMWLKQKNKNSTVRHLGTSDKSSGLIIDDNYGKDQNNNSYETDPQTGVVNPKTVVIRGKKLDEKEFLKLKTVRIMEGRNNNKYFVFPFGHNPAHARFIKNYWGVDSSSDFFDLTDWGARNIENFMKFSVADGMPPGTYAENEHLYIPILEDMSLPESKTNTKTSTPGTSTTSSGGGTPGAPPKPAIRPNQRHRNPNTIPMPK